MPAGSAALADAEAGADRDGLAVTKRSDLPVRTASAAAMIVVAGAAFWLGGWVLAGFIIAVGMGILIEWCLLVRAFERRLWARVLWLLAGVAYIGLACDAALPSVLMPLQLLFVVASVIAVDVGAYFAGRTFGGPRIAPLVSPSKTWSGLGGGIAAATALNLAYAAWQYRQDLANFQALAAHYGAIASRLYPSFPWLDVLLAGVLTAIVAQSGDFFESWMKRRAGVKDSGNLIPGHGGLFDRGDGLIAVLFVVGLVNVFAAMLMRNA
jgi:phosphatidate cytidylyltransferase